MCWNGMTRNADRPGRAPRQRCIFAILIAVVLVEEAQVFMLAPCWAEMAEIAVAQHALCCTAPPGLTKSTQRIDVHRRASKQVPEKPVLIRCALSYLVRDP